MTDRAVRAAALPVVLVLGALLAVPVPASAQPLPARDPEGYAVAGAPVDGGDSLPTALDLAPGLYTDVLAEGSTGEDDFSGGSTRYYLVSLAAGDRLHVAVTAPTLDPGSEDTLALDVSLQTGTGDRCSASGFDSAYGLEDQLTSVMHSDPLDGTDESCAEAGDYVVAVERIGPRAREEALPIEVLVRVEPPGSSDAPGVTSPEDQVAPEVDGDPVDVTGGTGFGSAPVLSPGLYTDRLVAGETRYYALLVEWGQTPAFTVAPGADLADGQFLEAELRTPLREDVPLEGDSIARDVVSASAAAPVRLANRDTETYETETLWADGTYYVVVRLGVDEGEPTGGDEVELTVALDAVGDAEDPPVFEATADDALPPAPDSGGGVPAWVYLTGAGVLSLAAVALLATSWRRPT